MRKPVTSQTGRSRMSSSKQCRACRRVIDADDAYCRYCGRGQTDTTSWLYHPVTLIFLAFAVLGPLAIPLVLRSPYLSRRGKTILNIAIIAYTILVLYFACQIASLFIQRCIELNEVFDLANL